MIVALIERIQQKQLQATQIERAQVQHKQIQKTLIALQRLYGDCSTLAAQYMLVASRLPETFLSDFQPTIAMILGDIKQSHEQFSDTPSQEQQVKVLTNRLGELSRQLLDGWRTHLQAQMNPYTQILKLVRSLPEIEAQKQAIDKLLRQLDTSMESVPQRAAELHAVDQQLDELAQRLSVLSDLSGNVRAFLEKVRTETATIADLTPEILDWCQDTSHTNAFKIMFNAHPRRHL